VNFMMDPDLIRKDFPPAKSVRPEPRNQTLLFDDHQGREQTFVMKQQLA
jgi:hypothetical protein